MAQVPQRQEAHPKRISAFARFAASRIFVPLSTDASSWSGMNVTLCCCDVIYQTDTSKSLKAALRLVFKSVEALRSPII